MIEVNDVPNEVNCSKCGEIAEEIEESYHISGDIVIVDYKCLKCGNIEKRHFRCLSEVID
jgi:hypothetical protein